MPHKDVRAVISGEASLGEIWLLSQIAFRSGLKAAALFSGVLK